MIDCIDRSSTIETACHSWVKETLLAAREQEIQLTTRALLIPSWLARAGVHFYYFQVLSWHHGKSDLTAIGTSPNSPLHPLWYHPGGTKKGHLITHGRGWKSRLPTWSPPTPAVGICYCPVETKVPLLCSASSDATLDLGFFASVFIDSICLKRVYCFFCCCFKKSQGFDQDWFALSCMSTENDLLCKINVGLQMENAVVSRRGRLDKDYFTLGFVIVRIP